jgi:hypothetical protein
VLVGTGVAYCPSATRAHERVFDTSGGVATFRTGQCDGATLDGVLTGPLTSVVTNTSPYLAGMAGDHTLLTAPSAGNQGGCRQLSNKQRALSAIAGSAVRQSVSPSSSGFIQHRRFFCGAVG